MKAAERLQLLEEALARLRRDADGALLVVEGLKDVAALDAMGVPGVRETVHHGRPLIDIADEVAARAEGEGLRVILLMDWDRTGGRLFRRLRDALVGRIAIDTDHRRRLAVACHCKCIEEIPADLEALRRRAEA